jgi:hypothetical protein
MLVSFIALKEKNLEEKIFITLKYDLLISLTWPKKITKPALIPQVSL